MEEEPALNLTVTDISTAQENASLITGGHKKIGDLNGREHAVLCFMYPGMRKRGPSDLLDTAWGIIANAGGGDWDKETGEWREAAEKWRDEYEEMFKIIDHAN